MSKFKVGDRVYFAENVNLPGGGTHGSIKALISHRKYGVAWDNGCCTNIVYNEKELTKVKLEEPMSKYQDLKRRIKAVQGWDKEADDILQEIKYLGEPYIALLISRNNNDGNVSIIPMSDNSDARVLKRFCFTDQCSKLTAFKSALLWLLNHSDIKEKDNSQEIMDIQAQIDKLQDKVNNLKEE